MKATLFLLVIFSMLWFHLPAGVQAKGMEGGRAKVLATSLNVRSGPDLQSSVIGSLQKNTIVTTITTNSFGWTKVTSGRIDGWVAGYYLQEVKGTAAVIQAEEPVTSKSMKTVSVSEESTRIQSSSSIKGKLIVIDPGHGGKDSGGLGQKYGTYEKTINLSTAFYTADKLRQAGAQVIMTRDEDVNPTLSSRVKLSESKKADAFVSIHYNVSPKPVSGTLTFFYSESKDMPLARKIEAELREKLDLKSNGISFGNYHVLRENARPSALVELGFLSNAADEKRIRTADYQKKAADAIVEGLKDYFKS